MIDQPLLEVKGSLSVTSNLMILGEQPACGQVQCMALCIHDNQCMSFAYNREMGMCRLLAQSCHLTNQHEKRPGWKTYSP